MKKIGILTFHRACNYGAQVQSYALSAHLSARYPQAKVEIIDYRSAAERKYYFESVMRNAIKVGLPAAGREAIRNRCFAQFADNLPISDFKVVSDDAEALFRKIDGRYDAVVVGSDAVFNWNRRKFPVPFFLGSELHCLKLSYAASAHALKYGDAAAEQIEYCRRALDGFDYIGVRDGHTERFVKHCLPSAEVFHNCDPSLLLDMSCIDYGAIREKLKRRGVEFDKPIVAVMTADERIVKPVYEALHDRCTFISLYLTNPIVKCFIPNLSPLEWAGVFGLAALTVTEYFHGTLLSLKNNTPVISVDRTDISKGYEGKIRDVMLGRLGLDGMYFPYTEVGTEEYGKRATALALAALDGEFANVIAPAIANEVRNCQSFERFLDQNLFGADRQGDC